jgi:hypothetical protein
MVDHERGRPTNGEPVSCEYLIQTISTIQLDCRNFLYEIEKRLFITDGDQSVPAIHALASTVENRKLTHREVLVAIHDEISSFRKRLMDITSRI